MSECQREWRCDKPVAVTLITKTATNPFFIAMQQGAEQAGKDNNVKVTTVAGKADGDEQTQIDAIEAAIARGDQGILITPATDAVVPKIQEARDAGLYVIALDTPPNPASAVDITFATDNFKAGTLIGKWMAGTLDGGDANIALLDLFNDKVASVDYNRDQGFLTGMGINVKDKQKNGDEAPDAASTPAARAATTRSSATSRPRVRPTGARRRWRPAWRSRRTSTLVYTINEPAAVGAAGP